MENRVTKIVRHSNDDLEVIYDTTSPVGSRQSQGVRSSDAPNPKFPEALRILRAHATDMLDLPEDWYQGMSISGVRAKYIPDPGFEPKPGVFAVPPTVAMVTLIAEKVIPGYEKPVKLTLPPTIFTGEALADCDRLFSLALKFASGERSQTVMEFEEADED